MNVFRWINLKKRLMRKVLGIVSCLFLTSSVLAQDIQLRREISEQHNVEKGKELIQDFSKEVASDRAAVRRYVALHNIETKGVYKDGRIFQLRKIDGSGLPIYYSTQNLLSRKLTYIDDLAKGGRLGTSLQGKNMIIGIWDGQTVFNKHQEFMYGNVSHVIIRDKEVSPSNLFGDKLLNMVHAKNHATHVAGTMIAKGVYEPAKGLAPEANLWSYDWDNDIIEMANAAQEGLLVSNHSYGISALDDDLIPLLPPSYFGTYNKDAQQIDRITYLYPYYQPVISAGNDREFFKTINPTKGGNDLLLGNANSKNAIVVAAVGLDDQGRLGIAKFSSYGPTNDYRIKPDIAAPGVKVISSGYEAPRYSNEVSTSIYKVSSGTSMAAPAVSSILALWQQGYIQMFKFPMRSATLRGLASHTAEYLEDKQPNQSIGWGMINASRGIRLLQNVKENSAVLKESVLFDKQESIYTFGLKEKSDKLLVTLSWTDVEGLFDKSELFNDSDTKKLVNDLDIRVLKDGEEYMPWLLNKDTSDYVAYKGDNDVDNLERVEIDNAEPGDYTVIVSHKGKLRYGRQDFSLIISNVDLEGIKDKVEAPVIEVKDITVWPNPVEDIVNIEITKDKVFKISEIEIFDLSNRLVKRISISATNRAVIDMRDFAKGVYLFNIEVGGDRVNTKVIKK